MPYIHPLNSSQFLDDSIAPTIAQDFSVLLKIFLPYIKLKARKFASFWYDDFVQEGEIALYKTYSLSSKLPNEACFVAYAKTAIKRSMIDYHRKISKNKKLMVDHNNFIPEYELELGMDRFEQPERAEKYLFDRYDFENLFDIDTLAKQGFTERDLRIFTKKVFDDHKIKKISEEEGISNSQVSKIVSRMRLFLKTQLINN